MTHPSWNSRTFSILYASGIEIGRKFCIKSSMIVPSTGYSIMPIKLPAWQGVSLRPIILLSACSLE